MAGNKKRFVRSRTNRLVGGVLGGIAEYFGWNANLLRLIYVLISLALPTHGVLGLLLYVIVMSFMPLDDSRPAGPNLGNLGDLFRNGGSSESQNSGRKVIHDVTEQDVKDQHKDGE
ncbi:PspC domain-containing protein [Levilactobacillus enshiensis]|uniref:PspC domain-containing protein n=1 Tax=Levilactobacillus enshiensis TaxID=2590213 RepID=UPI001179B8F3|nr:PspC domain-containing protein [Levilactobacillus enshiensis]